MRTPTVDASGRSGRSRVLESLRMAGRVLARECGQTVGSVVVYLAWTIAFVVLQFMSVTWIVASKDLLDGQQASFPLSLGIVTVEISLWGFVLLWSGLMLAAALVLYLARRASLGPSRGAWP